MKRGFAGVFVLVASVSATSARADDAAAWKQRGDEAMDAGRAAEALDAYRRAAAIAPSPSLDYNLGRALLATGDFVAALDAFEHYDATAPADLKAKTHRLTEVMAEIRGKIVTVEVTGDAGARLLVDGKPQCTLPCAPFRHNPGAIDLRVEAEDREPFVARRELAAGSTVQIPVVLARAPIEAKLTVVVRPSGARVVVDGVAMGQAPTTLALPPGSHEVEVDAPSYEPRRLSLVLARAESRRVDLDLAPERRAITSRWWFWTGVGVVVAGAAVAVVALTTERSPSEGSLGTVHVP